MTQGIIDSGAQTDGDANHTDEGFVERLCCSVERVHGRMSAEARQQLLEKLDKAKAAPKSPNWPDDTKQAVMQFIAQLPKKQRSMFNQWHQGRSTPEIAKQMGLQRQEVARSLAKVYADLFQIVNR